MSIPYQTIFLGLALVLSVIALAIGILAFSGRGKSFLASPKFTVTDANGLTLLDVNHDTGVRLGHLSATANLPNPTAVAVTNVTTVVLDAISTDLCGSITIVATTSGNFEVRVNYGQPYVNNPAVVILSPYGQIDSSGITDVSAEPIDNRHFRIRGVSSGIVVAQSWYYLVVGYKG